MPLVESIVFHIMGGGKMPPCLMFQDLVSYGVEGLIKAHHHYNPDKGTQFNTYAFYRIRGEILDKIRKEWRYRNPGEYALYKKKIQTQLADFVEGQCESSPSHLEENGVNDFISTTGMAYLISLDNIDVVPDKLGTKDPETKMIEDETESEFRSLLEEETQLLDEEERQIIELFYQKGMKQKEIAEALNFSKSKVCRLHIKVLEKLKRRLQKRIHRE